SPDDTDSDRRDEASSASSTVAAGGKRRQSPAQDRFDRLPKRGRVGAHRYTAKPRRFWSFFLVAIVGIAILTGLGILAVHSVGSSVTEFLDPPEPEPVVEQVQPELDPDATVAVLNGTE